MMALLYFPLQILWIYKTGFSSVFEMCTLPFFITWSPFWFMRAYVYLFLLAPVLNLWMDNSSRKSRFYLLIVLFLISHYVGSWGADASLVDGKNAITFSFIYVLGMMLREYKSKTELISTKLLATVYVGWNIVIVAVFHTPKWFRVMISFITEFFSHIAASDYWLMQWCFSCFWSGWILNPK